MEEIEGDPAWSALSEGARVYRVSRAGQGIVSVIGFPVAYGQDIPFMKGAFEETWPARS